MNNEIVNNQNQSTPFNIFVPIQIKRKGGMAMFISPQEKMVNQENNIKSENVERLQDLTDQTKSAKSYQEITTNKNHNPKLIKAFVRAYKWKRLINEGRVSCIKDIAKKEKINAADARRIYRLNFIAPDIVSAVLNGNQPRHLSLRDIIRKPIPDLWEKQKEIFGF